MEEQEQDQQEEQQQQQEQKKEQQQQLMDRQSNAKTMATTRITGGKGTGQRVSGRGWGRG